MEYNTLLNKILHKSPGTGATIIGKKTNLNLTLKTELSLTWQIKNKKVIRSKAQNNIWFLEFAANTSRIRHDELEQLWVFCLPRDINILQEADIPAIPPHHNSAPSLGTQQYHN